MAMAPPGGPPDPPLPTQISLRGTFLPRPLQNLCMLARGIAMEVMLGGEAPCFLCLVIHFLCMTL